MKKIFVKKSIKNLTVCAGIMAMLMGTAPAYAYTRLNEDQMIHQELIADMENAPKISAGAAIVIDGDSSDVLYEKNADSKMYPASMTKIMTCIIAIEKCDPTSIVTISDYAADVECTRVYAGNKIRVHDLIRQMMLISDNGAATAIGEYIAGSEEAFADMMNEKAKEIGMEHTHFVNMNGMPNENHYSTARAMAILSRYCMQNEKFRKIVGTKNFDAEYVQPSGRKQSCWNTNELLYDYSGTVGIKTGYTNAAGACLASAVDRNGHELIAIVMQSADDDSRFSESKQLFDYAFRKY